MAGKGAGAGTKSCCKLLIEGVTTTKLPRRSSDKRGEERVTI